MAKVEDINKIYNNQVVVAQPILIEYNIKEEKNAMAQMQEVLSAGNFGKSEGELFNSFADLAGTIGMISTLVGLTSILLNNLGGLEPVIMGLVGAFLVYKTVMSAAAAITGIYTALEHAHQAAIMLKNGATVQATIAEHGLAGAMLKNPYLWIAMLIVGVAAALAVWINKTVGLKAAWGMFCNFFQTGAENMQITIQKKINNILTTFGLLKVGALLIVQSMFNALIDVYNKAAEVINFLTGSDIEMQPKITWAEDAAAKEYAAMQERNKDLASKENEFAQNQANRQADIDKAVQEHEEKKQQEQTKTQQNGAVGTDYQQYMNNANQGNTAGNMPAGQVGEQANGAVANANVATAGNSEMLEAVTGIGESVTGLKESVVGYIENKEADVVNNIEIGGVTNHNLIEEKLDIMEVANQLLEIIQEQVNSGIEGVSS